MAEEEIRTALLELEELLAKAYSRNPDAVFYEQQERLAASLKEVREKIKSLQEKLPGFYVGVELRLLSPAAKWENMIDL